MKQIEKDEIYEHLSQFLKSRGVEMKDGSYVQQIQKGCSFLTDSVNLAQQGLERAKTEMDKRLDQMRQVIHEKTAPKSTPNPPGAGAPRGKSASSDQAKGRTKTKPRVRKAQKESKQKRSSR
jgi:hypothetical protein